MKTQLVKSLSLSLLLILISSCVSKKELTYLQYSDRVSGDIKVMEKTLPTVTPSTYKIMPFDNLFIRVVTPDPQWSSIFNMDFGQSGLTQESAGLSGYSVDADGNIEIPYVGRISVAGKTLSEIKTELEVIFKNYVADAAITVRLVNNYISILGEVSGPGRYPLTKDRINIFEAISMAGDLSVYGNRQKIQLLRPSPYGPIVKEFSLQDRTILSSEYYYIMPNDIIYVIPMQGKAFSLNTNIFTLFLTTISTALVIISYFRSL